MNAIVMKEEEATEAAEGSYMDKLGSSGEGFDGDFLCFNPPYFFSPTTTTTTCSPYSSPLLQSLDGQPHYLQEDAFLFHGVHVTQKSSPSPTAECSSSLSSMSSSPTSLTTATVSRSKTISKKKTSTGGKKTAAAITTGSTTLPSAKKPRIGGTTNSTTTSRGTIRVRKEKLGERILALQQLVSPFGKSDTASVLHEALGYIRFLHDQVQVLSSPYLQRLPPSAHMQQELRPGEQQMPSDLRSRGLCLVPISCTEHVAGTNGADMWSPAAEKMNSSSSSSYSFPASSKH